MYYAESKLQDVIDYMQQYAPANTEEVGSLLNEEPMDVMAYTQNVETKPSLWERIKNMKLIRGIRYLMKIKVVLELPEPDDNK